MSNHLKLNQFRVAGLLILLSVLGSCQSSSSSDASGEKTELKDSLPVAKEAAVDSVYTNQITIIQQQAWENLRKVTGRDGDYVTNIRLRIANGNVVDADCLLKFPKSSWMLASIYVSEYQGVLKNTSPKIFEVFYKLITDENILASEINITGLWRPFMGSHVHIDGRGIDIGDIRSSKGSGVIFNFQTTQAENAFGLQVRSALRGLSVVTQYFCPWYMCSTIASCAVNLGQSANDKLHRNHLHLTLKQ